MLLANWVPGARCLVAVDLFRLAYRLLPQVVSLRVLPLKRRIIFVRGLKMVLNLLWNLCMGRR